MKCPKLLVLPKNDNDGEADNFKGAIISRSSKSSCRSYEQPFLEPYQLDNVRVSSISDLAKDGAPLKLVKLFIVPPYGRVCPSCSDGANLGALIA